MDRDTAVVRIQDGLGFATRQASIIILRLQEAQRDLEKGKTLPKFLLQEDQPLTLVSGTHTIALPTGFLRMDDDNPPHFTPTGESQPTFISMKRSYKEAVVANATTEPAAPVVGVIRNSVIDFIVNADMNYSLLWNYYKAASLLTTNIENEWLANAPEWLIGEAGWRMAMDARDKDAVSIFEALRKSGRAAVFGEIIASEEASGPLVMGANL